MKFEEWLAQQDGVIEVDCGCVTTEAFLSLDARSL